MADRYLKQVIVVRKDLSMPTGKLSAMVAHAAMSFIIHRLTLSAENPNPYLRVGVFSKDEIRWMTELDPGLEALNQVSFAKIVASVDSEVELSQIVQAARIAGLHAELVYDSGHSHNHAGDLACAAIGPAWPEQLEPVTGHLKVYR